VSPWQSWLSILLVAFVLVAFALYVRRQFRAPYLGGRRPLLTGGSDLLGLIGAVVRGAFYLAFSFLLLGRLLFWPRGRRW
jgi:membrane protein implicated in regulation of membrane protease activity